MDTDHTSQSVYSQLGIKEGDAHVIRNAGGAAYVPPLLPLHLPVLTMLPFPPHRKDALRSIIISQRLLGTREIAVFHHTGCGMLTFDTAGLRARVKADDPGNAALGAVDGLDFLEFAGLEESVRADVRFLEGHPRVLPGTKVTGWVYEVETGKVRSWSVTWRLRAAVHALRDCGEGWRARP